MSFLVNFNALDTETLDTNVLDISSAEPVWKHLGTRMLCTEDEKLLKHDICLSNMLPHRKSYLSFHDLDYAEKIKELQCFLDSVKKIASPGCSQEVLNVALSLMSALVGILSAVSGTISTCFPLNKLGKSWHCQRKAILQSMMLEVQCYCTTLELQREVTAPYWRGQSMDQPPPPIGGYYLTL